MSKIGRNHPCPCGSGKKYKKCCGVSGKLETKVSLNLFTRHLLEDDNHRKRVQEVMESVNTQIRNHSLSHPEWDEFRYDTERIEAIYSNIEEEAQSWFSKASHTRHYLYMLIRRILPEFLSILKNISGSSNKQPVDPHWEEGVISTASDLILKCKPPELPHEWVETPEVKGIQYELTLEEIDMIAAIAALAQTRYEFEGLYRLASKGIPVFEPSKHGDVSVQFCSKSIENYERRRDKYQTLTASAGIWYDPLSLAPTKLEYCVAWDIIKLKDGTSFVIHSDIPECTIEGRWFRGIVNEERIVSLQDIASRKDLTPIPVECNWNVAQRLPYDTLLSGFSSSIEAAIGIPVKNITAFLYALNDLFRLNTVFRLLDLCSLKEHRIQWPTELNIEERKKCLAHSSDILEMGLIRVHPKVWHTGILERLKVLRTVDPEIPELEEKDVTEIINRFTFSENMDRGTPVLFIPLSQHTLVTDLFRIKDFFRNLFLTANKIGSQCKGDETGVWLEQQAAGYFERELGLDKKRMVIGEKIKNNKREVDIAFVYNRVLFVIDCKAMAKDFEYIDGKHSKIRNRFDVLKKELKEKNPQRIDFIRQGVIKNKINPSDFDKGYGLVCTAAVEYLPLGDETFWYKEYTLVGPPEELICTIREISEDDTYLGL